jgi:hypothetical protein
MTDRRDADATALGRTLRVPSAGSFFLLALLAAGLMIASRARAGEDVLGEALAEVGFTRADLGYRPAGYWNRFPLEIPHRLPAFDDLSAEPLRLYDVSILMGNAVERYLKPAYADSADDGLYQLVYSLGVDRRRGGFRSYSANLRPPPGGEHPFASAVEALYRLDGRETATMAFGEYSDSKIGQAIEAADAALSDSVRVVLAELVVNLTDAVRWHRLAFRNCNPDDLRRAAAIRDLASTQADGQVYYPELDDIAATIDWASLHYAALKTAAAAERAERRLLRLPGAPEGLGALDRTIDLDTPFGRIVILSTRPTPSEVDRSSPRQGRRIGGAEAAGTGGAIDASNTLLLVDFAGDRTYHGTPGAALAPGNPVSVLIDLAGDDAYGERGKRAAPSAGAGLLGIGLVLDSRGDDRYEGGTYAQGAGLFGVGVLLDRAGNDRYRAGLSAQGCGYFGIGLCLDGTGRDEFYLYGDGQGHGGVGGGVGVLASFDGDDAYTAEPSAEVFDRGDYHSDHKINGNAAQGVGFGRRGDGSDGHAWAGGLGAIIDIRGDDRYHSGNWSLGCGYWFGTGIALDRSGDDVYKSCYFTQGSGAHYSNGILIDEAGDDRHELFETAGAALGFGWDYTNALLIDTGGDDLYRAKTISMGLAQIRSTALLIDIGGNDRYFLGEGSPGLGEATWREGYDRPRRLYAYDSYSRSFGGFLDIGGRDTYRTFTDDGDAPHTVARDGAVWLQPARDDSLFGADNYGVGVDVEEGTVPEFFRWVP